MDLKLYYGKHIAIITYDGKMFAGFVNDYIDLEDNENGLESIVVDTNDGLYEFNEDDIKEIRIYKK